MYKVNFETGVDNNFDGHCDICGRFVNKYGQHRAAKIFDYVKEECDPGYFELDKNYDSLSTENFIKTFIKSDPYNMYKNMTYKYWPYIYKYTRNIDEDPLSCKHINDFLRYDILPKDMDYAGIVERILEINIAINQFEVKDLFVTYRGLSFYEKKDFIQMLDDAYNSNKMGKLFEYGEKGFTSTTRDLNYAKMKSNANGSKYHVLFAYVNLPGSKAMPLSKEWGTTHNDIEQEVLLKSYQTFYISSIQRFKLNNEIYYRGIIINSREVLK